MRPTMRPTMRLMSLLAAACLLAACKSKSAAPQREAEATRAIIGGAGPGAPSANPTPAPNASTMYTGT